MKRLRKYGTIARISLANAVAYRASILSGLCFYTVFIYVFFRLWQAIYQEGSVNGYTYVQIVWYLIMTELVTFGCRSNIRSVMDEDVKSGSIAYLINRPTHYIFYQLANSVGQILLNLACFGGLALALGMLFVGPLPTFRLWTAPFVALSLILGIALNFFFTMIIGLCAFYMEDSLAIMLIFNKITFMLGVFLPVEFLPGWLQVVAKNLPFSYIAWAPAKLFVDFSFPLFWELVPRQALWGAATLAVCLLFYHWGVRRLQVNGG